MNKLKPCPFCGSEKTSYEFCGSQGYIACNDCHAEGPLVEEAADPECSIDAAEKAWDSRKVYFLEEIIRQAYVIALRDKECSRPLENNEQIQQRVNQIVTDIQWQIDNDKITTQK